MYYDNKSSFYIKQYGPAVIVLIVAVVLIGSGIYVYLSTSASDNTPNKNIVAEDKAVEEEKNALVEEKQETKVEVDNSIIPSNFESLKALEKTGYVTVNSIDNNGKVNVSVEGYSKKINITLIGLDFGNATDDIITKMQEELAQTKVKLAFDNKKVDNSIVYAYIYTEDNTLYNAKLLEDGLIAFKENGDNNSLDKELKQAQTFAKQTAVGVWSHEE